MPPGGLQGRRRRLDRYHLHPGRFMATGLPTETPQFAFADHAELNGQAQAKQVPPGSAIVAGKNSAAAPRASRRLLPAGLGSSRWSPGHFARIFCRTPSNSGSTWSSAHDRGRGRARARGAGRQGRDLTTGNRFPVEPLPKARQAIIDAGGLVPYTRRLLDGTVQLRRSEPEEDSDYCPRLPPGYREGSRSAASAGSLSSGARRPRTTSGMARPRHRARDQRPRSAGRVPVPARIERGPQLVAGSAAARRHRRPPPLGMDWRGAMELQVRPAGDEAGRAAS